MRSQDQEIWKVAKKHLNVRNNDEHTLFSYLLAQKLLENYPEANADIVLPAILLHDTGWSKIPKDKILHAFGPNNKYPELTRQHELESVAIAEKELPNLGFDNQQIEKIIALIDGHDTTKNARSLEDSINKDADKLSLRNRKIAASRNYTDPEYLRKLSVATKGKNLGDSGPNVAIQKGPKHAGSKGGKKNIDMKTMGRGMAKVAAQKKG
jgi:HD superfamily phosphodiesterase